MISNVYVYVHINVILSSNYYTHDWLGSNHIITSACNVYSQPVNKLLVYRHMRTKRI